MLEYQNYTILCIFYLIYYIIIFVQLNKNKPIYYRLLRYIIIFVQLNKNRLFIIDY